MDPILAPIGFAVPRLIECRCCKGTGHGRVDLICDVCDGHPARKATWLYVVGVPLERLPDLKWGQSAGRRLDEGFHSKAERDAARAAGRKPVPRLSKDENVATPIAFRDALIAMARSCTIQRRTA